MPRITVEMFEGRTAEQKRAMVKGVTEAVVASCGVNPEAVTIVIREMRDENYANAGVLRCDNN